MTDALKQRHPDVTFATIGDYAITALAQLAKKIKDKFQKPVAPEISQAPLKAAENKHSAAHMAKLSVIIILTRRKNNGSDSQWTVTSWIIPAKLQP
jgi:hypothetical protein